MLPNLCQALNKTSRYVVLAACCTPYPAAHLDFCPYKHGKQCLTNRKWGNGEIQVSGACYRKKYSPCACLPALFQCVKMTLSLFFLQVLAICKYTDYTGGPGHKYSRSIILV